MQREGRGGEEIGGEGRGRILEGRGREWREGEGRGKLHGMYPDEGTGQYTVHSQTIPQRGLALETLVLQIQNSEQV